MQARVKLMPLLSRQVVVDTIVIDQPLISVGKDKDGRFSWQDILDKLAKEETPPAETTPPPETGAGTSPIEGVAVAGVQITDGTLIWDDQQSGQKVELTDLDVNLDGVDPGEPTPVSAGFDFALSDPDAKGRLDVATTLTMLLDEQRALAENGAVKLTLERFVQDGASMSGEVGLAFSVAAEWAKGLYTLRGVNLTTDLKGDALPAGALAAALTTDAVNVDMNAGTAQIPAFSFNVYDLKATGGVNVNGLNATPNTTITLKVDPFSPREVLKELAGTDIPPTDPNVLAKAMADVTLTASADSLNITKLAATLDDTNLNGNAKISNFAAPNIGFDLNVDGIDADRYMPPEGASGEQPTPAPEQPGQAEQAGQPGPDDMLKKLTVNGKAKVGRLKAMNVNVTDINLTVTGKNGVFRVEPLTAMLYEGRLNAAVSAGLGQQLTNPALKMNLQGLQIGPFLKDYLGKLGWIGGATDLKLDVKSQGGDVLMETLSGLGDVVVRHGIIRGFTLVPGAVSQLLTGAVSGFSSGNTTEFDQLGAEFFLKEGKLDFKKLFMVTAASKLESSGGSVNLVDDSLNIPLNMVSGQFKQMQGIPVDTLPLALTGSLSNPTLGVDKQAFDKMISGAIKGQVEQKLKDIVPGGLPIPGLSGSEGGQQPADQAPAKETSPEQQLREGITKGLGGILGGGKKE